MCGYVSGVAAGSYLCSCPSLAFEFQLKIAWSLEYRLDCHLPFFSFGCGENRDLGKTAMLKAVVIPEHHLCERQQE